ncbi:hypothetical protein, partial [Hydrogenibacillus schlegelii]|uniref:hypothetical protein n=1 Tax=Hydrogenibacillus schlegelii TaxID=1484 RepID=UPI0034A05A3F
MAIDEAVRAGADPDTVEVIEVEEVPLAYLPGNAVRIKVKAAGPSGASDRPAPRPGSKEGFDAHRDVQDLQSLAVGAAILGTGGGGDP